MENPLSEKIKILPDRPGVYQFFDKNNTILYVGKAKNLKKRVASYFVKKPESAKTRVLVSKIIDIQYIVVDTELEALLLENSLIKELQPRYNVMLKDDKTYPWICIKNERFPRVFSTRNIIKDGSQYFGPYASVRMMKTVLEVIHQLYKLRNCNYVLSEENIKKKKYKVCLEYHIGNCLGPCEDLQSEADYNRNIEEIKHIIKGNIGTVKQHVKKMMQQFSDSLEFEKAQAMKEKLAVLEKYQSRSTVVNMSIKNTAVFSFNEDNTNAYVNYMRIIDGAVIQSHTLELKKKLEETPPRLLEIAMTELRNRFHSDAREIIVPFLPETIDEKIKWHIPERGDKLKLLTLSERNVKFYMLEKQKRKSLHQKTPPGEKILQQLQSDLHLPELPVHIECFDNSNIQGTTPVAACVVFKNGRPANRDYRHFNVKTVEGPNDFASMEEIVHRRYSRLLRESEPLPQLIIIDGGKGQLSSAVKALEMLDLRGKITIIGIAKRLEEIYFPGDSVPIYLDKRSTSLRVIQHLRNEAHRFGITFHRNKRNKFPLKSELEEIPGIGKKTVQQLLQQFKSVAQIKKADKKDLIACIGKDKANKITEYFIIPISGS